MITCQSLGYLNIYILKDINVRKNKRKFNLNADWKSVE